MKDEIVQFVQDFGSKDMTGAISVLMDTEADEYVLAVNAEGLVLVRVANPLGEMVLHETHYKRVLSDIKAYKEGYDD